MNIAIIIYSMDIGGAERTALMLANHLSKRGEKVHFFLLGKYGRCFECPYEKHMLSYDNNKDTKTAQIVELFRAARSMKEFKKKLSIDVSISFMEDSNYINVFSSCGDKIILSVHTTLSARSELNRILYNPYLISFVYNRANAVIAVSNYTKKDLINNYGINRRRCVTIPNAPLNHSSTDNIQETLGDKVIIHVGRFDPVKQQDRIIRAFSYVHKRIPESKLVILGDGSLRPYLKYICKMMGVEDAVVMPGFCVDVVSYLRNSRLLVMASKAEGFPNVMVEAMSEGLPVVTTDSPGGCGEIVGKKKDAMDVQFCMYGVLTPYIAGNGSRRSVLDKEEIMLGQAMYRLLIDDNLYKMYSERSRIRAEYYSVSKVCNSWDKLIYR